MGTCIVHIVNICSNLGAIRKGLVGRPTYLSDMLIAISQILSYYQGHIIVSGSRGSPSPVHVTITQATIRYPDFIFPPSLIRAELLGTSPRADLMCVRVPQVCVLGTSCTLTQCSRSVQVRAVPRKRDFFLLLFWANQMIFSPWSTVSHSRRRHRGGNACM